MQPEGDATSFDPNSSQPACFAWAPALWLIVLHGLMMLRLARVLAVVLLAAAVMLLIGLKLNPGTKIGILCFPACDSRGCGDDGCGGSCGRCPTEHLCRSGQCVGSSGFLPR